MRTFMTAKFSHYCQYIIEWDTTQHTYTRDVTYVNDGSRATLCVTTQHTLNGEIDLPSLRLLPLSLQHPARLLQPLSGPPREALK